MGGGELGGGKGGRGSMTGAFAGETFELGVLVRCPMGGGGGGGLPRKAVSMMTASLPVPGDG